MSTPTRIPPPRSKTRGATLPLRRALIAGLCAALAVATPVDAAPPESAKSLRAKRQVLVTRIAALTDELASAQVRVADAERKLAMTRVALVTTRTKFARRAVEAYVDGIQQREADRLRRRAYAETLAEHDREVLGELLAAKESAEKQEAAAAVALEETTRTTARLDAMRTQLERTLAERVTYERAQARLAARARAAAGSVAGQVPRHRRATMSQAELMATYRFGPTSGIPDGLVSTGQVFSGRASWYGPGFDGRPTASGAIYDQEGWTVAHRTLRLGTILLISHGGRSVVALVNDRGPFVAGRVLDLSHGVANALGTVHAGVASVRAEILAPA